MAKAWTRNQKLVLTGLIIAGLGALGTWITKVQIQVKHVRSEIEELKVKTAEVDSLRSKIAEIETVTATSIGIGTKSPRSALDVRGIITSEGFDSFSSNEGRITILGRPTNNAWAIGITGKNLFFQQLENGIWINRQILTSTGLVTKP